MMLETSLWTILTMKRLEGPACWSLLVSLKTAAQALLSLVGLRDCIVDVERLVIFFVIQFFISPLWFVYDLKVCDTTGTSLMQFTWFFVGSLIEWTHFLHL